MRLFITSLILETDLVYTQQSRFLALVGNYEEYSKALETAANAEDTGTLQTLKSLDSISAKWTQLKTNIQQFYASSGLEQIFKTALDGMNNFLSKANTLPKLFGKIPTTVISMLSVIIMSIKQSGQNMIQALTGPINEMNKKLNELKANPVEITIKAKADTASAVAAGQQVAQTAQQAANGTSQNQALRSFFNKYDTEQNADLILLEKATGITDSNKLVTLAKQLKGLSAEERNALLNSNDLGQALNDLINPAEKTLTVLDKFRGSSVGGFLSKHASAVAMVASTLSAAALSIEDSSDSVVENSKTLSGGISTIAGIGLGIVGQWQYAIPMLLSGIPSLIDGIIYTTEEKLENARKKAEELNNEALKKKSEYKDLKNQTTELKRLEEARYDSTEAMQEYLDYSNQMADTYPELIGYIDAEGNSIIDLANSYSFLESARIAAGLAAKEAILGDIEQSGLSLQDAQENLNNFISGNTTEYKNINGSGFDSNTIFGATTYKDVQDAINNIISSNLVKQGYTIERIAQEGQFVGLKNAKNAEEIIPQGFINADNLFSYYENYDFDVDISAIEESLNAIMASKQNITNNELEFLTTLNNALEAGDSSYGEFISNEDNFKQLLEISKKIPKDSNLSTVIDNAIQDYKQYQQYKLNLALAEKQQKATERKSMAAFAYYDNEASDRAVGEEIANFNEIATNYLMSRWKEVGGDLKDYLTSNESADYEEFEAQFQEFWNDLTSTEKEAFNSLLGNQGMYSRSQYQQALIDAGVSEYLQNELMAQWTEEYGNSYQNFLEGLSNANEKNSSYIKQGSEKLNNIPPELYSTIKDFYDKINKQITDGIINSVQGTNILDAYSSLIAAANKADNNIELLNIIKEADLTTLSGLYALRDALAEADFEMGKLFSDLADNINVNLITETQTILSDLSDKLKTYKEDLDKASSGMSFEEAISMAEKIGGSLSDFKFEGGEYFLKDLSSINEYYNNFENDLVDNIKTRLNNRFSELTTLIRQGKREGADVSALEEERDQIKELASSVEEYANQYTTYLENTFLLSTKQYGAFISAIGTSDKFDTAQLMAAAAQGETALYNLLSEAGADVANTYISSVMDTLSSIQDDIVSRIESSGLASGKTDSVYIGDLIEGLGLGNEFNTITDSNYQALYKKIFGNNQEAYNNAMANYFENSSKDIQNMLSSMLGSLDSIDASSVAELGTAMKEDWEVITQYFTENLDGTFSTSYQNILALVEQSGQDISTEVYDALKEYFDSITSIISNGLKGSMSSSDVESLNKFLGFDVSFTKTAEGLKLTKQSAIDVYLALKDIDAIQAQITFNDLADNLKEAGSGYEDVADTMRTIAKLNDELANVPVDSSRREELEKELQVAQEILRVRSVDPDSFNFMDKTLPEGMQGPENYWNSVGKAYKVMNESAKSGYMEIQDYVNIVNQMSAMAEAAGVDFEIKGMNAAQLIEKGMSALTNVDGEGVKIAMEGIGFDFLSGAEEMGLSFDDGIKEVAKSQIKMLDAAIRILEAMVAMEDIDVDNSGYLEMDEIFANGEDASKGWTTKVENWAENLNASAGEIRIGGKSLLDALATLDPSDAQKALNALMSIDWDSSKDIASQIQSVLAVFFPDTTFTQGRSIFDILQVPDDADTNNEEFQAWLKEVDVSVRDYLDIKRLLETNSNRLGTGGTLFQGLARMLGIEDGSREFKKFQQATEFMYGLGFGVRDVVEAWSEIEIVDGEDGTTYLYNGASYNSPEEALAARELQTRLSGKVNNVEINEENGQPVSVSGELTIGEHTINVSLANGQVTYTTSDGQTFETERQAIDHEVQIARAANPDGPSETQLYETWGVNLQVEALGKVSVKDIQTVLSGNAIQEAMQGKVDKEGRLTEPITLKVGSENIEFKAGSTEQDIRQKLVEAMGLKDTTLIDAITTAIQTAAPSIGEAISTAISDVFSGTNTEGESNSLTIKPTSLNVDLTGAEIKTTGLSEDGSLSLPDGTIGTVSGTANEIQIDGDYTPAIPEEGITLTYDTVSGETTTIKITPTNYSDDSQTSEVKIDGTYNSVKGKADSATIDITTYTVDITDAEGNTETVTVEGEANLTAIINGLTQGEDGSWTLSLGNSSVIIETPNYDEIVGKLAELSAPETKTITVAYEESPLVGPGVDSTTTGYHVAGIENNFGNKVTLGQFSTLDAAITSMESEISNGTFQNGTFEITEIKADGSTVTTTATLAELTAGVVNLNTNSNNNNNNNNRSNNNNNNTHSNDTNTSSTQLSIDTSAMEAKVQAAADSMVTRLANAGETGAAKAAQAIKSTLDSIKGKTVSVKVSYPQKVSVGLNVTITGTAPNGGSVSGNFSKPSISASYGTAAKGNVALAKGKTLMGELGPELVVSNGRYFIVGQNGAEFVDLADDAIVFNHLQTQSLLNNSGISGRGTPVTNEKNATSLATGNAMASASDALAQLRAIRAMWQSMLDASAADLGAMAGSGGGGGGGGGGGKDIAAVVGDYERWYNLLRQIDKWEQKITYEQAKRENMRNGYNQVDSLEKELDMLKKQQAAYEELAKLQKDFYDKRRQDLLSTDYSLIFTYDEDGLMQYVDGVNRGLDILAKLNERDATGKLINNAKDAKTQLSYLESIGFDTSILKNNEDGTITKDPEEMMQNFWDNIDGWMDELDSLYDTYNENLTSVEEVTTKQNEILQQYIDNQLSLEEKLLQAIQDREQAEIDRLSDEKEALEEATQSFIDGLTDALDKERDLYNKNQNQKETDKLQRQLAILMRSGGSASEIQALRDQIDSRLQDEYFDKQQEQIDAIQEASDNQLEKLQEQIDLMTETLDYQKENGLLWEEVYNMMNNWTPEQLVQFLDEYTASRRENSALQNEQDREEDRISAEMFVGKRDLEARNAAWERYYNSLTYSDDVKRNNAQAAQTAFNEAYASGGETAAIEAANRIYNTATQVPPEPEEIQPAEDTSQTGGQNAKVKGGQMNVRKSASSKAKGLGIVRSGKSFKAVGYKGGWLKVEDADVGGGKKVSGYMKYSGYSKYYEGIDINKLPGYSQGGLVDFTGPVMVHGSKNKPEAFLSAEDTALLKSTIFNSNNNVLQDFINALENRSNSNANIETAPNVVIEEVNLEIASGTIANDYDAKRAGEKILEEMVKISRKTTNRVSSRR